ncbi:MAG: PEGA domain-containing protein [Candidatus Omnitrophota bacterium]
MKGKKVIAGAVVLAFLLTGCASIVSKNMYPMTFNSHPDGATIVIKDENGKQMYKGKTPTTLSLSAGEAYFHPKKYTITLSKPGYEEQTTEIKAGIDGWYFGNIIFGGIIGLLIVDPLTGNMWKLPSETTITLAEQGSASNIDRSLKIVTINQIPENVKKQLVKLN